MTDYTVADVSYDEDGELEQFLLFWDDGEPDTRRATPENKLLYDPENELPFDGGLRSFFDGETALQLGDVAVAQSGDEYSYILSVNGNVVETTPSQSEELLEGVYDALTEDDTSGLRQLHEKIVNSQVRRRIVNAIKRTFSERDRIEIRSNGWLIDGFFFVDWDAKLYTSNDDRDSTDYVRDGSGVVEKDTKYEFVQLRLATGSSIDCDTITVDGEETPLTEREMLFLAKVKWVLHREHYHPDEPFWKYVNQWADMPSEEPNLDLFEI